MTELGWRDWCRFADYMATIDHRDEASFMEMERYPSKETDWLIASIAGGDLIGVERFANGNA